MVTLVSFLGKGQHNSGYRDTDYIFDDGDVYAHQKYIGLALQKKLEADKVILLGTSSSMWDVFLEAGSDALEEQWFSLSDAVKTSSVTEELLQPFEQYIIDGNPFKLVIKQVDSIVSTNGVSLKRFITKNVFNQAGHFMDTIIQHVGSKYKLFGNNGFITPPDCFGSLPSLRCYSDDDISIKFTEGQCDKLTSVNEVLQGEIKIFPNPVTEQIYIQQKELVGIVLYDFQGKKILNLDVDPNLERQTINLVHLPIGQYFLMATDQNGRLWYNRFQKL